MKLFSGTGLIIGMMLLLSITQIHAARMKHQAQPTTSMQNTNDKKEVTTTSMQNTNDKNEVTAADLATSLGALPLVGATLEALLNYLGELVINLDKLTNGLFSRVVGGTLPCEISIDEGIQCSGTSTQGGVFAILKQMINDAPPDILPSILKKFVIAILEYTLDPMMDVLFGGLEEPK